MQEPWIVSLTTGRARQVLMMRANAAEFAWNPTGSRFAFSSDHGEDFDVWMYDLTSEKLEKLTEQKGFDGSPAFGPQANRLAFISNRSGGEKLWIMDLVSKAAQLFDPLGSERGAAYRDVDWK